MKEDLLEALSLLRAARSELDAPLAQSRDWFARRDMLLAKYPEEPKLLPCPFCSSKADVAALHDGCYIIRCTGCDARTFGRYEKRDAISAWNRRAKS